jgi:hypothetical protein
MRPRQDLKAFERLCSLFLLVTFLIYLILVLSRKVRTFALMTYSVPSHEMLDPNSKLLIGIVTVPHSTRFIDLMQTWGFQFERDPFASGLVFLSTDPKKFPNETNIEYHSIYPDYLQTVPIQDRIYNDRDKFYLNMPMQYNIGTKQLEFLKYFLENTSANWFVRITDDVYVNRYRLPEFLRELNEKYNPTTDFYIGGCCLDYVKEPLLQGGSGFVVSRYAAQLFLAQDLEWLRTMAYYDDWHFSRAIPMIGLSLHEASSGRFIGHPQRKWERLRYFLGSLRSCPELKALPFCASLLTRVSDTIFFHDDQKHYSEFRWFRYVHTIPDDVYWYQNGVSAALCRKTDG